MTRVLFTRNELTGYVKAVNMWIIGAATRVQEKFR
jgi:hypothetical protein